MFHYPSNYSRKPRLPRSRCATKRIDVMSGKLHSLYRQAMSPWGVAPRRCIRGVK
jgi:hypothetical protein